MAANTLLTGSVVKLKEDVEDYVYNFSPDDAPLVSAIKRDKVHNVYFEWERDTYRAPNPANATIEGADASYGAIAQPGLLNNRTQIFQDAFSVSGTAEAVGKYGRKSEIDRIKVKRMVELKRDQEAAYLAGGAAVAGSGATAARTRGLYGFASLASTAGTAPNPLTNTAPVDGTDRALTEQMLKDGLQSVFTNGGRGDAVYASPAHKVKISTFTGNVQRTNEVGSKGPATLNAAFDFYRSDFGVHKIVPNRVQAVAGKGLNDTVYIVDHDKLKNAQLRSFESEELAKTGDATNWQVRTETGLKVLDERTIYMITDILAAG